MKEKILIVEDGFIEAEYLRLMLARAGYRVIGIAHTVPQAQQLIKLERPDLVILDIFLKGDLTGIDLAAELGEDNIAFIYLSANCEEEVLNRAKATKPYGFLVKPFRENDLLVTLKIARYRHEHSLESKYRQERELRKQLEDIAINTTAAGWEEKLLTAGRALQPYVTFDLLAAFYRSGESSGGRIAFLRVGFDEYQTIGTAELKKITNKTKEQLDALAAGDPKDSATKIYQEDAFERLTERPSLVKLFAETFELEACLTWPLYFAGGESFMLSFYSRKPDCYGPEHLELVSHLQTTLTRTFETVLPGRVGTRAGKDERGPGGSGMQGFEGIIGKSHLLLKVFDQITQVAPVDTSVLILGESGTGKERIADAIHQLSPRKNKPFVKINCAALPPTLIESELFGHEKGSFTGAMDKRLGKFEKADKGTIFLDEVGEMPLELQVKLLRVLQEKYIERIGASDVTKVDVRVIAATNRNLEKEVAEGRFRLDLYYRLNVFPVELPPLRDRREDIPAMASHFVAMYNRKTGKQVIGLSENVLRSMEAYHWPGNIRELENCMERCVLLAKSSIIEEISLPAHQKNSFPRITPDSRLKTIDENERDHIMAVLKQCDGKIWGSGGAAELLSVPPSTLKSKMKKLGIRREKSEWI
jgi:DNA-binding NtrC family response regulator